MTSVSDSNISFVFFIKHITGIDLFPAFPNLIQNLLESRIEYLCGLGNIFLS